MIQLSSLCLGIETESNAHGARLPSEIENEFLIRGRGVCKSSGDVIADRNLYTRLDGLLCSSEKKLRYSRCCVDLQGWLPHESQPC